MKPSGAIPRSSWSLERDKAEEADTINGVLHSASNAKKMKPFMFYRMPNGRKIHKLSQIMGSSSFSRRLLMEEGRDEEREKEGT